MKEIEEAASRVTTGMKTGAAIGAAIGVFGFLAGGSLSGILRSTAVGALAGGTAVAVVEATATVEAVENEFEAVAASFQ